MKKFVIVTDSCSDLPREAREKYDIEYVPMHFTYDSNDVVASLDWEEISAHDFYDIMRGGTRIITSQVNAATYREAFEKYIAEGYDILSISCSAPLSASVKASYTVRDELVEKYPDARIICIDSRNCCAGLGILCIEASKLRSEGKTIDEVAKWVEDNRRYINQEGTVDKLTYLRQAGRVSAASAFFGGILNIKPIIISDVDGRNVAVEKVKGRRASMDKLIERFRAEYAPSSAPIFISHADCIEEAEALKAAVLEVLDNKDVEIYINYVGPIVGASVGPGMLGIYFYGKEVIYNAEEA